jgi:hypothetical protein
MKTYLTNPFSEAYVTHTVSETNFVKFFSPVLVIPAVAMFQPGNVVVKGTQGSGKSMLLRLLEPEIRHAYFEVDPEERYDDTSYPIPRELRNFISSRVDLNKSGLLDIVNTLPASPTPADLRDLVLSFADFFNYWLLRGLLQHLDYLKENPDAFEDLVDLDNCNAFAQALAGQDCWFGNLSEVNDWDSLKEAVRSRVIAYRAWANGNAVLPEQVRQSRTSIGEPLSRAAEQLKRTSVIKADTNVFLTIDQIEALWMAGGAKAELGKQLRREIHEVLGKRDERVSYRIGARRHDWGKGGNLAMRDGRELEEGRDFLSVEIDEILQRGENPAKWMFKRLAKDVFRRRVRTTFNGTTKNLDNIERTDFFFGPSPSSQELVEGIIKTPDPSGDKLLKLDGNWPQPWREAISKCYNRELDGIPQSPSENYPVDPLNALLLVAWGLQTGGGNKKGEVARRCKERPPETSEEQPWNKPKQYWRKERYPLAVMQLVSRHQQGMVWWGEAKVFSLCGSNILRFITICRETWDYWQRLSEGVLLESSTVKPVVAPHIQARAINSASQKIYEALKRQPGQPAGDVRIRFLDAIVSWLRSSLLEDKAMSYPGRNGFSLRVRELEKHRELREIIEEAVGWGDLYEREHTSKSKVERSRDPRKKYYINPALSPVYQLPESHTKEPFYTSPEKIIELAKKADVFPKKEQEKEEVLIPGDDQLNLFSDIE